MQEPNLRGGLCSLLFTDGEAEAQTRWDQETKARLTPRSVTELIQGQDGHWTRQAAETAQAKAERPEGAGVSRKGCLEGGAFSPSLCQPAHCSQQ